MYRIYLPVILITASEIICYYFLHDFSICAISFITLLLFFSWIFRFPEGEWLKTNKLHEHLETLGEIKPSNFMSYDKPIKVIIHDYVDLKRYSITETRISDTEELIEDTQEAIVKTLIPYLLIFISSLFTLVFLNKQINNESYADLLKYKNYVTITYIGVAFCYIAWNVAPLMIQKKKNKMSLH